MMGKPNSRSSMMDKPALSSLYSVMQSIEGRLGGGEGICGIYGSITQTGTDKIFDCLRHNTGFDTQSVLVDVGAGLGRPLLHALVEPGIRGGFGIELDEVKVHKAHAFVQQTMAEVVRRGAMRASVEAPTILCSSIEEVPSLDPATHAYSFWEGVPLDGKAAFGKLFAASRSLKAVAVVQRSMRKEDPSSVMQQLGFGPLLLISSFPVKMSGSGRSFAAYVFSKITPASQLLLTNAVAPHHPMRAATPPPPPCVESTAALVPPGDVTDLTHLTDLTDDVVGRTDEAVDAACARSNTDTSVGIAASEGSPSKKAKAAAAAATTDATAAGPPAAAATVTGKATVRAQSSAAALVQTTLSVFQDFQPRRRALNNALAKASSAAAKAGELGGGGMSKPLKKGSSDDSVAAGSCPGTEGGPRVGTRSSARLAQGR